MEVVEEPVAHSDPAPPVPVRAASDDLVVQLFEQEGVRLVQLARMFVDDRTAAEDLVQEAFIRLARSRTQDPEPHKAAAYLRSIVLNLARDHNRRGLVSLRHRPPRHRCRRRSRTSWPRARRTVR